MGEATDQTMMVTNSVTKGIRNLSVLSYVCDVQHKSTRGEIIHMRVEAIDKRVDHRRLVRSPDLTPEEQAEAEAWAAQNAFAVPTEFLQFPSGSRIQIFQHSNGNRTPVTVATHPVWDGIVSPADSAKTTAQKYLVPGIYTISYNETLLMKYRRDGQVGQLPTARIDGWIVLTAVKKTSHRRIIIGSKHAYYLYGIRQPEKLHLEVQKYEGTPEDVDRVGTTVL